jgi:RNA polymerase sigma-70 factor (ECF subfamily)
MADPRPLSAIFLSRRGEGEVPGLEAALSSMVAAALAAWPGLSVTAEHFVAYAADRVENVNSVRAADLYLAACCAAGDARAIGFFDSRFIEEIDPALSRLNLRPGQTDEVKQILREQLLVGRPPDGAKIAEYTGRGDLRSWVRVSAVRAALKLGRKGKREVLADDEAILEARSTEHDPELLHIKAVYRQAFKAAFQTALDSLSDKDRLLLRQHVVDGLSIDELGALHRVHRATAARWVAKVKETLLLRTREKFMGQVRVGRAECESIMRLVESQLDLSLKRRLG